MVLFTQCLLLSENDEDLGIFSLPRSLIVTATLTWDSIKLSTVLYSESQKILELSEN